MSIADYSSQISQALQNLGLKDKDPEPAAAASGEQEQVVEQGPETYGDIGTALLNIPFPEMVKNLGMGIADAQFQMDMVGARMSQILAGMPAGENGEAITIDFGLEQGLTLFELGFTPSFYQFTETVIDLKMTLSYASETVSKTKSFKLDAGAGFSQNANWQQQIFGAETASARANVSTMNAENMSKYNIKAEGTSSMRTTLVSVPPPAVLEERIRMNIDLRKRISDMMMQIERTGKNLCDLTHSIAIKDSTDAPPAAVNLSYPQQLELTQEADIVFEAPFRCTKTQDFKSSGDPVRISGDSSVETVLADAIKQWTFAGAGVETTHTFVITFKPSSELSRLISRFSK